MAQLSHHTQRDKDRYRERRGRTTLITKSWIEEISGGNAFRRVDADGRGGTCGSLSGKVWTR